MRNEYIRPVADVIKISTADIITYSKKSDARSCLFQRLCLLLNVDFIQCRRSAPLGAVPYAMAYSLNGIFPAEISMQLLLDV